MIKIYNNNIKSKQYISNYTLIKYYYNDFIIKTSKIKTNKIINNESQNISNNNTNINSGDVIFPSLNDTPKQIIKPHKRDMIVIGRNSIKKRLIFIIYYIF